MTRYFQPFSLLFQRCLSRGPKFLLFPIFIAVMMSSGQAFSGSLPFLFSSDLPAEQKQTVLSDLEALNHLQFNDSDGNATRLFGIPLTAEHLKKWLSDRSQYIISEKFNYATSVKVVTPDFAYPNPELLPYREFMPPARRQSEAGRIVTVMTNMGAHIYIQGKKAKNLLSANLPGIGNITINSPRIGLFKIGEGLFIPLLQNTSDDNSSSGNSLRRLAVYFHEARHSDGNGKSLGFLHAICPENKGVLAGSFACDRNLNGPYTIEGTFLRSTVDNCRGCSRREKEALRNIYADKFNRVIKTGTVTDPQALRVITDTLAETCNNLKILNATASVVAACNQQSPGPRVNTQAGEAELRPALLDERPEGVTP